jgi:MoxR-like ATPase
MNDDESTYEVPDYILSRLQPTLEIGFPSRRDEMEILRYHLPFAEEALLQITVEFLQRAHGLDLEFSPRDGIHIVRYALKRLAQQTDHPLSVDSVWAEALERVLGAEALDLDRLAAERDRSLGEPLPAMDLQDFFFDQDDPLHPDSDEENPN